MFPTLLTFVFLVLVGAPIEPIMLVSPLVQCLPLPKGFSSLA
jgi:hypothetical protein